MGILNPAEINTAKDVGRNIRKWNQSPWYQSEFNTLSHKAKTYVQRHVNTRYAGTRANCV